jgi:ABC-type polar amino acid transport system ATPase subunit
MVWVTHEMGSAREVADRVLFMHQRRVLERAEPDRFFQRPGIRARSVSCRIFARRGRMP